MLSPLLSFYNVIIAHFFAIVNDFYNIFIIYSIFLWKYAKQLNLGFFTISVYNSIIRAYSI